MWKLWIGFEWSKNSLSRQFFLYRLLQSKPKRSLTERVLPCFVNSKGRIGIAYYFVRNDLTWCIDGCRLKQPPCSNDGLFRKCHGCDGRIKSWRLKMSQLLFLVAIFSYYTERSWRSSDIASCLNWTDWSWKISKVEPLEVIMPLLIENDKVSFNI